MERMKVFFGGHTTLYPSELCGYLLGVFFPLLSSSSSCWSSFLGKNKKNINVEENEKEKDEGKQHAVRDE